MSSAAGIGVGDGYKDIWPPRDAAEISIETTGLEQFIFSDEVISMVGDLPQSDRRRYGTRPWSDVKAVYFHHTATSGWGWSQVSQWFIDGRMWPGMAYHDGIATRWDGGKAVGANFYHLQPYRLRTYHTAGYNSRGISCVLLGNYQARTPDPYMTRTIAEAIAYYRALGINEFYLHRDVKATLCPGDSAAPIIRTLLQ